jgi:hypothetical protein
LIGTIIDPYKFLFSCKPTEFFIYDKNRALHFLIKSKCFQLGSFFFCKNNYCRKIEFGIFDRRKEMVGLISHVFSSCQQEYCSKADFYQIEFPEYSTIEEKILIICSAIFIDYILFENV